jgi:hypothetical protein
MHRYFTRRWWVISAIELVVAPLSRLVARELITELEGVYSGYRLQVHSRL